ncbi:hypothetical protein ACWDXV_29030 [Nocardia nova]|jgi:hypothetical protein|uniref:hypothetical protein n=1 Tax=Nocardia TaxID=1817 RepID=UPI0004C3A8E9|nr:MULTISPECIES: hypothetical protein [Nocardia]MBF6149685.1 hypothetical protein [Nocardia nova]MDN2498223.1 hypothetical protein [Nocardia nova]PPJ12594.1 hypothetical protein C5E44_24025 [Nocardia nova]
MQTLIDDLTELWRVTAAALIFGAGLPAIFALGVRLHSIAGDAPQPDSTRRRAAAACAGLCYAVVLLTVIAGVLFVARGFLAARLGIHLFGQG